jgi:hypothetical protein
LVSCLVGDGGHNLRRCSAFITHPCARKRGSIRRSATNMTGSPHNPTSGTTYVRRASRADPSTKPRRGHCDKNKEITWNQMTVDIFRVCNFTFSAKIFVMPVKRLLRDRQTRNYATEHCLSNDRCAVSSQVQNKRYHILLRR